MKKFIFLFFLMLLSFRAHAYDVQIDGIYYNLDSSGETKTATVTYLGYSSGDYSGEVVIPESVMFNEATYSVTSIGKYTFKDCSGLISVIIPKSVTTIDHGAFYNCSSLTSVTIPSSVNTITHAAFAFCTSLTSIVVEEGNSKYDSRNNCNAIIEKATNTLIVGCKSSIIPNSVTSIGIDAFAGCSSLSSIAIPNSVTSIGDSAFFGCSSLTTVTIPNSVTIIDVGAFAECSSLTSITIPVSVTSIGSSAFRSNPNLASIIVENGNSIYDSRDNCNAIIETNSNCLITGCKNTTIPNSVTSIGDCAFDGCSSLTSIIIPDGVTSIGSSAFSGCSSLTSITIPNSVTSIENGTFNGCSSLTTITIPDGVTSIGNSAFSGCSSLTSITIPNSVTSIDNDAFDGCSSLTSIIIPDGVTSIGSSAFRGCSSLTSITIPNSVTSIDNDAFDGCSSLTSITIPNSVTSIGGYAFNGCSSLTSITIPNSVTSIENGTFNGCNSLTSIIISDGVTSIDYFAFNGCSSLTSITIPNSVTSIGGYAFNGCSGLTSITIPNSVFSIGREAFNGTAWYNDQPDGLVYAGKVLYKVKGNIPNNISIKEGTLGIADYAFDNCFIYSIDIPEGVECIGDGAFRRCSNLQTVELPSTLSKMGYGVFFDCSHLTYVISHIATPFMVKGLFSDPSYMDENELSSSAKLYVPDGSKTQYESIAGWTQFADIVEKQPKLVAWGSLIYECNTKTKEATLIRGAYKDMTMVSIDKSVTMGDIPYTVTTIEPEALMNCGLKTLSLPSTITSIGAAAFKDNDNLKKVLCRVIDPLVINDDVFEVWDPNTQEYMLSSATLYVDKSSIDKYTSSESWLKFKRILPYNDFAKTKEDLEKKIAGSMYGKKWSWNINSPEGYVWGNMGYCGGEGCDVGILGRSEWWGVKNEEDFMGQLQQTNDGLAHGDESMDAYMTFGTDGSIVRYAGDGSIINKGTYEIELVEGNPWKVANLHTTEGTILWPYEINSGGNMPTVFEVVYLSDEELTLVYPDGGDFDSLGSWGEATYWHFASKGEINEKSETITIGPAKQVPYCSEYPLDFTDLTDLSAYVATGYDKSTGTIWLTRVKQVPANTGFLLVGEAGDYEIPVIAGISDVYYKNMFKGTISGETIYTNDGDYTNYYLSSGTSGVGFYKVTKAEGQSIGANRCYLPILTDIPAAGSEGDAEVIKVSAAKQVPYFTSKNLDFSTMDAQGVKAYTATGYNYGTGVIWLTRVKKVPAHTGVLVMAGEAGEYSVPTASVASVYENMFAGSETAQTIQTNETVDGIDYVNYYLSNGEAGVGFYKVTNSAGQSLGANRCYLQVPYRATASGARGESRDVAPTWCNMIFFDEGDDVIAMPLFTEGETGIQSSMFNDQSSDVYYNLQGQRVEKPGKGIYIKNGKKVVIK